MKMKLDLDDLERKADQATKGSATPQELLAARLSPLETLMLVRRIREIEDALRLQCDRIDMLHESYTKVAKDPLNVREIIDKGVVLP